jgi:hypothetical protein
MGILFIHAKNLRKLIGQDNPLTPFIKGESATVLSQISQPDNHVQGDERREGNWFTRMEQIKPDFLTVDPGISVIHFPVLKTGYRNSP